MDILKINAFIIYDFHSIVLENYLIVNSLSYLKVFKMNFNVICKKVKPVNTIEVCNFQD